MTNQKAKGKNQRAKGKKGKREKGKKLRIANCEMKNPKSEIRNPKFLFAFCLLPFAFCFAAACQQRASPEVRTYTVQGRVIRVAPDRQSVVIQHEDIQGFMPAMTMSFPVKDPAILGSLASGDLVRFDLTVTAQESWIARIEKTGKVVVKDKAADEKQRTLDNGQGTDGGTTEERTADNGPLTPGQVVPNFTLTDQNGRRVSLENFRGKAIAITFIFTRCPLPEYCPRFTSQFAAVQNQLSRKFPDRFQLLSISIDPAFDTPNVLKEYGRRHGADFQTWNFLTGPASAVRAVANAYSVTFWPEEGSVTHTSACAVLSPSRTLYKLYRGNTWTSEEIISDLTTLLTHSFQP